MGRRRYDRGISASAPHQEKARDADRSRETILAAAEALYAERGYDGVSLSEIGAAAGLSRATPSYFFGSKEQLYTAVLERVSAARQEATAEAVQPVVAWCEDGGDLRDLRKALRRGMEAYMAFLLERPSFARFITWEELAGAERLRAARRSSTALEDAFGAVHKLAKKRGLQPFEVSDAVLLWIGLTYGPLANRHTLLRSLKLDLTDAKARKRHVRLAADQLMFLLAGRTR